ncbi:MAG TPA: glycosyltransferase family 1 protein [Candidatus Woesebacteria bacterium]|nr:glycosyltransferase family 1 protein [Candidatus Woesebacteria bacterium]
MNIGIDITSLIYQRGVSRYTANLVRALKQFTSDQLSLFGYSFSRKQYLLNEAVGLVHPPTTKHEVRIQSVPPTLQAWLWKFGLNRVTSSFANLDLFHSWDWLQPPDTNIPIVSTIHDLAILRYPDTAHPSVKSAHQRSWTILKKRQAHIIAVSHATKKDVIELLEYPNWLVHVVPEALPVEIEQIDRQISEQEHEFLKAKLKLKRPYLLFVGVREPRKNLERVIQAWQPLSKDIDLIIAGEKGWDQTEHLSYEGLRFLGRVSDKELSVLYAEAEIFLYPSLYEGFGLPILEAFQHGTPVITSDISAMIEVAGNAAELVNPESIDDINEAIQNILNENSVQQQQRLQRMIIRKQMFSWQKVAKQTTSVYQQAINDFNQ